MRVVVLYPDEHNVHASESFLVKLAEDWSVRVRIEPDMFQAIFVDVPDTGVTGIEITKRVENWSREHLGLWARDDDFDVFIRD